METVLSVGVGHDDGGSSSGAAAVVVAVMTVCTLIHAVSHTEFIQFRRHHVGAKTTTSYVAATENRRSVVVHSCHHFLTHFFSLDPRDIWVGKLRLLTF